MGGVEKGEETAVLRISVCVYVVVVIKVKAAKGLNCAASLVSTAAELVENDVLVLPHFYKLFFEKIFAFAACLFKFIFNLRNSFNQRFKFWDFRNIFFANFVIFVCEKGCFAKIRHHAIDAIFAILKFFAKTFI